MPGTSLAPRYDLQRNPPYQINYRSKRAGKHVTATKRRVTFQFGFSSAEAIASGEIEAACRGEEHEVVLIWSHVSGKRELFMDGKPVHASKAARGNTKFQFTWNIGSHVLKIVANGTPPMGDNPHQRQFDLQLDGISFFRFFRIYQLGRMQVKGLPAKDKEPMAREKQEVNNNYSREPSKEYSYRGVGYAAADDNEFEEEEDTRDDVPPALNVETTKMLDLFDTPSVMTSPTMSLTSSTSSFDEFSPVRPTSSGKPSFDSSLIMSAYNNNIVSNVPQLPYQDESRSDANSRALVPVSEDQVDVITKSMKSIVNLDDINSKPFQPITQSSTSNKTVSSNNWGLVGRQPTLAEMQSQMTSTQQQYQAPIQSQPYYGQPPMQHQPYGYNGINTLLDRKSVV